MPKKFGTLAIAGTFDRLHKGHQFFISKAFETADKVIIGLTSDAFASVKLEGFKARFKINSFVKRKEELTEYLLERNLSGRFEITEINDIYGPVLKRNDIEALAVTEETREGGEKVNNKRFEAGMEKLEIVEIPLILALDDDRISSTRIRHGEIDRWGRVFERLDIYGGKIPGEARLMLKKPLGKVLEGERGQIINGTKKITEELMPVMLVTVGDEATGFFNKYIRQPDISVVDFYIKRIKVHETIEDLGFNEKFLKEVYENKVIDAVNPAGEIRRELVTAVKQAYGLFVRDGKERVVRVSGEEDLAGVPAILLAPLGTIVFYGQPDRGMVAVEVTEEKKQEMLEILK